MNRPSLAVLVGACALSWLFVNSACGEAAALPSPSASTPQLNQADLEAWLDGFVPAALQKGEIAGAVLLVLKDGNVLLEKGYGAADIGQHLAMDPETTVLGVGSVSKLFTWTAVMQQVEQGKLDLDRDVNEYLDFKLPAAFGKPITLRNLMTHTAGFAERVFRDSPDGVAPRALREYLQDTMPPDRIYPPGEVLAYSNYGAMLAGYIVERVSGEPFVAYVQRHILEPLDMSHSTFQRPPPERFTPLAKSYSTASSAPNPVENEEPAGDPSGHLIATARDLSHFMLAHLQEGRYGDTALLKPETIALMHAPAFVAIPGGNPICLGFFRTDYNGREIIAHMGDIADFHADLELLTHEKIGYLLILNSSGTSMGVLNSANAFRTALFRRFMDRYFPTSLPDEPTLPTAKDHARLAAGEYRMTRRYSGNFMEAVGLLTEYFAVPVRITVVGDKIETPGWLSFEDGQPQQWREVSPFAWRQIGGQARVNMAYKDGRVTAYFPSNVLPAWVNERVPLIWSASLNAPLFIAASVILFAALLYWPLSILVHRKRGQRRTSTRSQRLTRWAVLTATLFLLGWAVILGTGVTSKVGTEPWIRLVQLLGLIATGGAVVGLWNAFATWQANGNTWAKIGNTLVALALLELVWFSFAFHLISLHLNY